MYRDNSHHNGYRGPGWIKEVVNKTCHNRLAISDKFIPRPCGAEAVAVVATWYGPVVMCAECAYKERMNNDKSNMGTVENIQRGVTNIKYTSPALPKL